MTSSLLRHRKDRAYSVVPSGSDYYAFWADGRAGLYVDGSFISYRSTTGPSIPEAPSLIHIDDQSIVGPGSIVTRVGTNALGSIRTHVPRYQPLRGTVVEPSRFGNYDGW